VEILFILPSKIKRLEGKAEPIILKSLHFLLLKLKKATFLVQKKWQGKNEQLCGKCGLTSRLAFVAPLYHQTETTGIMKTIQTIITGFKKVLGIKTLNKTPQLIALTQEHFCQNMTITDYYCDENNLFI
jgi:hypothetical protein